MHVEWDEGKRQENIQKHGLDFVGAEKIFEAMRLISLRKATNYERRIYISQVPD